MSYTPVSVRPQHQLELVAEAKIMPWKPNGISLKGRLWLEPAAQAKVAD